MARTTKKQFEDFCRWCDHYRELFGLVDWDIYYSWKDGRRDPDFGEAWAASDSNAEAHSADVVLNKCPRTALSDTEIKDTALHEIVHVALAPMELLATQRFVHAGEVQVEHERETVMVTNAILRAEKCAAGCKNPRDGAVAKRG